MKKHTKAVRILLLLLSLFIVYTAASLLLSRHALTVTRYTVSEEKVSSPVRIVLLADQHGAVFGKENARLIEKVRAEAPDLICIAGDLVDARKEDTTAEEALVRRLTQIAPVYVSLGNHELEHEEKFHTGLVRRLADCGAAVLEYAWEDVTVAGQPMRLGGLYGYCLPARYLPTGEAKKEECAFLTDFQDTDLPTVLLCHMPACFIVNDGVNEWNMDLVLAGHAHGGQIRLPFVGGLWAPDQGWWPGREAGIYPSREGDRCMVLSRGLGSTEKIPRFNNIPEIVTVDLVPAGK